MSDIDIDTLLAEVRKHNVRIGIMASPSHWAYRGDWKPEHAAPRSEDETPGDWFAHCTGDSRDNTVGCGWDSEPTTYETREEAWEAGHTHVAESVKAALEPEGPPEAYSCHCGGDPAHPRSERCGP